jgi:taurine--2-oxoglutarate transaminase
MFWGIELTRNRPNKTPFNTREEKIAGKTLMVDQVSAEAMKHGTYVVSWLNTLIVAPPLIASKEEIDQGVSALDESLNIADMETA